MLIIMCNKPLKTCMYSRNVILIGLLCLICLESPPTVVLQINFPTAATQNGKMFRKNRFTKQLILVL